MSQRKKLIEVALPLEAINIASAREKSIRHGHPSTLHLWWARRPLAAARAVIFSSLVDDPDDPNAPPEFVEACRNLEYGTDPANDTPRQRLFKFIEVLVQWESTIDEQVLGTARELIRIATGGNPPPLLDPFAGGGTIPLEAQRLGLEAHASDLNPVAVMINKAQIEIPTKFADLPPVNPRDRERGGKGGSWGGITGLAADIRYYGEWMRNKAWERIGHLYPDYNGETVIAWLWARTVKCPNPACGAMMPLTSSFELSKKRGTHTWIEPHVEPATRQYYFNVRQGSGSAPKGTVDRRGATCLVCGTAVPLDHVRAEGRAKRMGVRLMAVVTQGKGKRTYNSPTSDHEAAALIEIPEGILDIELLYNPRYITPPNYGMTTFASLYTPRQLVALAYLSDLVSEAGKVVYEDAVTAGMLNDEVALRDGGSGARAYAGALIVYLAFSVDRLAQRYNSLSGWDSSADLVRTAFARQALSMVWDFADANPFSTSTGNFADNVEWVAQATESIKFSREDSCSNTAFQVDAATSTKRDNLTVISTDPPYYDNIGYADLSDFFYVWMRRNLREIYPELFATRLVPKEAELIANTLRFEGNREAANKHFENGLQQAFTNMRYGVDTYYPLSVYYAFKQAEADDNESESTSVVSSTGWETMLSGLIEAGFVIGGTWPMRTELGNRTRNLGANALASSIVLVCRPRAEDAPITSRREFLSAIRQELPLALRELQSGNIAPVDMAQASIGPGMAVYSRYSKVIEPNGDRLSVRTALQIINQELDAYLAAQEGDLDGDSRFAVAWFEQHGFATGQFGNADVLARAKNTSVEGLQNAGVLEAKAGKVRLYKWSETDPGWDPTTDKRPTTWEAVHHLIERLNTHGEDGAAMLLAKMPSELAAQARQLAYRLYSICERKGWAEYGRDYNALVVSWGASQERASQFRDQYQQGRLDL